MLAAGCTGWPPAARDPLAAAQAEGFVRAVVPAGAFDLTTLERRGTASGRLVVYIEGDGRAYRTRRRASSDPTPRRPVSLELARRDPSPWVLWIARPCQYLDAPALMRCDRRFWTTHRYAESVVEAIDVVIDRALGLEVPRLGLVGWSGGGTVAALVAARRDDVAWLITVAANLDHRAWTRLHGVTPLAGSLNPPDRADRLRDLPQLHLVGAQDEVVPEAVVRSYLEALGNAPHARLEVIEGFDHHCCWSKLWPAPLEATDAGDR